MKVFCANDIRGIYPEQVNEEFVYKVARSFAKIFKLKKVVVGHDIRLSGQSLKNSIIKGLIDSGCDVFDIGQCGTEMIYFTTSRFDMDGGIMITASHNPKEYNGLKLVQKDARPVSKDNGLKEIEKMCCTEGFGEIVASKGKVKSLDISSEYIDHLLSYINVYNIKPLRIVANTGNGAAGPIINMLEKYLPIEFIKIFNEPDGNFPNGVPNPILTANRLVTSQEVIKNKANLGIAWDGDFDRCFLFDEMGNCIEGYYMVGFLAQAFMKKEHRCKIIHDPRLVWNTQEICANYGGEAVVCRSGHAFIKEKMRAINAAYGGEMSSHHYFRDFSYCDSGMIPWLLVIELLSLEGKSLGEMIRDRIEKFPCSNEINLEVIDVTHAKMILDTLEKRYGKSGKIEKMDGLSVECSNWRFNIRCSNTEPFIRLNLEARGDKKVLEEKKREILSIIHSV